MGNYLEKPNKTKETLTCEGNGMKISLCSMQGWRITMEDAHFIETSIPENTNTSFFGVFDGHGGSYTACYASTHLLDELILQPDYHKSNTTPEEYGKVLQSGFMSLDKKMREIIHDISGSTAITAFVTPKNIICGNLGDSRCLLSRDWLPVPLSSDHKPEKEGERSRIVKAGGSVINGRVNDLAVSRAFGDYSYKRDSSLGQEHQLVSCCPDIAIEQRTPEDNFLILACDGIWDVMTSPARTIEILKELFESYENPKDALSEFIEICLQEGSKDNMTVMVIFLNDPPKPIHAKVEAKKASKQMEQLSQTEL